MSAPKEEEHESRDGERRVRNDGGILTPIFCTAQMPREVLKYFSNNILVLAHDG